MAEGETCTNQHCPPEGFYFRMNTSVDIGKSTAQKQNEFAVLCVDINSCCDYLIGTETGAFFGNVSSIGDVRQVNNSKKKDCEVSATKLTDQSLGFLACGNIVDVLDIRESSQTLFTFKDNVDDINDLKISPDGTYLAAADDSGEVRIYDLRNRSLFKTLRKGHKNICSNVSFPLSSTFSSHILTGGLDCQIVLWDYTKLRSIYSHNSQDSIASFGDSSVYMFNPPMINAMVALESNIIISGLGNGSIEFLDLDPTKKLNSVGIFEAHASTGVTSVCAFTKDDVFVTGGNDCEIKLWDLKVAVEKRDELRKKKKRRKGLPTQLELRTHCSFSNDSKINVISCIETSGNRCFIVGDQTSIIKLYDICTN